MTLAGAAIPKAPQELKPRSRSGWRKVECFDCAVSGAMSRAQIRDHGTMLCPKCEQPCVPSDLDDCAELAPDLLPRHPLYVVAEIAEQRATRDHADEWCDGTQGHCECGWRMPPGADPDYFYCRKCGKVNERHLDGTMGSFRAHPFSAEVEEANGRVRRDHAEVIDLDRLRPATRAEQAERRRNDEISAALPF